MNTWTLALPREVTERRLLARRNVTASGCWEWTGYRRNGYGRMSVGGRLLTTHRVAAAVWLPGFHIDSPLHICHRCDNPPCLNPEHLFPGTHDDNMADAVNKGRMTGWPGPHPTTYPRKRPCEICGAEYEPDVDHRGRSRVCSPKCLGRLRSTLQVLECEMTTTWTLVLPFSKPPLSLNDRGQTPGARAAKSAKAAEIKHAVFALAKAAQIPPQDAIHVRLHWQPRDRRRRDRDNPVATLKPAIDGLVAAGVVPDDDPAHVDWSAPWIHEPNAARKAAMWLVVTAVEAEGGAA